MKTPCKFSVVITNYNKYRTISRAVTSARNQTDDLEIIIVDDCSTDGSQDILSAIGADQVIFSTKNMGALSAYVTGIRAATGEFIVLLDGDDELIPGILVALQKSGYLHEKWMLRLGMVSMNGNRTPPEIDRRLRREFTFRPGSLFTYSDGTGGAAFVFPRNLFQDADNALNFIWPKIVVQDHFLPGIMAILASRVIRFSSKGYLMAAAGEGPALSLQRARMDHDRLVSSITLCDASERKGTALHCSNLGRLILRLQLSYRTAKLADRYDMSLQTKWIIPRETSSFLVKHIFETFLK